MSSTDSINIVTAAARAEQALQLLRDSMEADGYDLSVGPGASELLLRIKAKPHACAECLVPKPMFLSLVQQTLKEAGSFNERIPMRIIYPADLE